MTSEDLRKLYTILDEQTPLSDDCGRLCDCACCFADEENDTLCGVDLLPIEAKTLADVPWADIVEDPVSSGPMLMCREACDRARRPWLCRIFPLCTSEGGKKIRIDARARAVCPLAAYGLRSLSADFKQAVKDSTAFLASFEDGAAFIGRWESIEADFRRPLW